MSGTTISPFERRLLRRAEAARKAIRYLGADPYLMLSLVVWPSEEVREAEKKAA